MNGTIHVVLDAGYFAVEGWGRGRCRIREFWPEGDPPTAEQKRRALKEANAFARTLGETLGLTVHQWFEYPVGTAS